MTHLQTSYDCEIYINGQTYYANANITVSTAETTTVREHFGGGYPHEESESSIHIDGWELFDSNQVVVFDRGTRSRLHGELMERINQDHDEIVQKVMN